jgi:carbamoyl-phosphate synthase large subunit
MRYPVKYTIRFFWTIANLYVILLKISKNSILPDKSMTNLKKRSTKNINMMFTCIGRRVSLLNSFKQAAKQLKLQPCIIGTDASELSSALQICDKKFVTKPVKDSAYLKQLLDIVKKNKVHLLIPTVDFDLKLLAQNKSKFEKLGCTVLISAPEVIDICQDKRETFRFLAANNFHTPETLPLHTVLKNTKLRFPLFLKPWDGYASRGNAIVTNRTELLTIGKRIPNCIAQKFVKGVEYTCDVFVDFEMKVRCVVPRRRIEVRSGEVSKGQIVKDSKIMNQSRRLVEKLGAGPGVVTIQLMVDKNKKINFIEMNPRFGGGVPLSIKAGANFPKWILQQLSGKKPRIKLDGFKDKLIMLRYDNEVWLENK